jgi:putative Holliday junction resolvase
VALDLGARRIGVAVCDRDQRVATASRVLDAGDRLRWHRELAAIVAEYEAVGVVVGLPRSLNGELGTAARAALEEAAALREALGLVVDTVDERLTTVQAAAALRAGGHRPRARRMVVDQVASAVLLQSWLDRRASTTRDGAG